MSRFPDLTRTRIPGILLAALLGIVLSGCTSMPQSGPVHEVGHEQQGPTTPGAYYDPQPPHRGADPGQIVAGFLEAMKATPVKTSVAKQYLTPQARAQWHPESRTITYQDVGSPTRGTPPLGSADSAGTAPQVELTGAAAYDARGAWQGTLPGSQAGLQFQVQTVEGQWRLSVVPDAMVVPDTWFAERYERALRYYFDPTGRFLVPEPVFVPSDDQMTTQLVRGLLSEPPEGQQVLRTAIPAGLSLGLSVPITSAGVADVQLTGPNRPASREEGDRMVAQLVWTLRQEPRLRAVRVLAGDKPLPGAGGDLTLDRGAQFSPVGADVDRDVYGIRKGQLVRGPLSDLSPVGGQSAGQLAEQLGDGRHPIEQLAVDIGGRHLAVVADGATRVLLGAVSSKSADEALTEVAGGVGLGTPSWDLQGRLWLLDQPGRTRIRVRALTGELREVSMPGLSGRRVRQILVSRDGTRLVALVAGRTRDRVVVSRIRQDPRGEVLGLTRPRALWLDGTTPARVRAIGWRSAASVAVLSQLGDDLGQVQTTSVDGSPMTSALPGIARFRGRVVSLLTSPVEASGLYVMTRTGVIDAEAPGAMVVPDDVTRLLTFTG